MRPLRRKERVLLWCIYIPTTINAVLYGPFLLDNPALFWPSIWAWIAAALYEEAHER